MLAWGDLQSVRLSAACGCRRAMADKMETESDVFAVALDDAERLLDGEIIVYNGPINEDGYGQFVEATKDIPEYKKLVLILITYSGSADSAYRIARYAQSFFTDFVVIVPSMCKSAGTLTALGASKIYMSPFGELGPLDVQVFKADEIFERRSGLLSKSAVWSLTEEAFRMFEQVLLGIKVRSGGTVGFKVSSHVAASITSGLLAPVMSQLDPLAIGEDYQNLHIAQEYGERLIAKYGTIKEDAVSSLVEQYPSHGFVIDFLEADKLLGNVELTPLEIIRLQGCLAPLVHRPNSRDIIVRRLREDIGESDEGGSAEEGIDATDRGSDPSQNAGQSRDRINRDRAPRARRPRNGAGTEDNAPPRDE